MQALEKLLQKTEGLKESLQEYLGKKEDMLLSLKLDEAKESKFMQSLLNAVLDAEKSVMKQTKPKNSLHALSTQAVIDPEGELGPSIEEKTYEELYKGLIKEHQKFEKYEGKSIETEFTKAIEDIKYANEEIPKLP